MPFYFSTIPSLLQAPSLLRIAADLVLYSPGRGRSGPTDVIRSTKRTCPHKAQLEFVFCFAQRLAFGGVIRR
ncbi:hypothetical protein IF1G_01575 [Cordyceps javanica]|uniref:Uncharacterized protein n=1 Tax=Cordyceps javanica TaxID=43265 RepID=A0A545VCC1_9HYPO|nr:hypothetical protein IF1G_01575 [Cordyceps javanica]